MSNVIELSPKKEKHISGEAFCTGCGHVWAAAAPVGTTELDCPSCFGSKGIFRHPVAPENIWKCDCGNLLFYISPDGCMCRECGKMADFDQEKANETHVRARY